MSQYSNLLNGFIKFERMLEDNDKKYSEPVKILLLDQLERLELGRKSEEYKILMNFKKQMMEKFGWPYHPRYNPNGVRDENSDKLDELHKRLRKFGGH